MGTSFVDFVIDPRRFFSAKAGDGGGYLVPALIVFCGAAVTLLSPYIAASAITGIAMFQPVITPAAVAWYLLSPFLAWALLSLVLWGGGRFFVGKGSFPETFRLAGYGMLPLTLNSLIGMISDLLIVTFGIPAQNLAGTLAITFSLDVLSFALVIWSGYLWMAGLEAGHGIARRQAMIAAGCVTVVYILWKCLPLIAALLGAG